MARPKEEVVLWAAQDVTLPALAGPNKVLPISDLINKGWDMNQKPAADEFNYLLNNYAKWLVYLDEKSGGATVGTPDIDRTPSTIPLRDPEGSIVAKKVKGENNGTCNYFDLTTNTNGFSRLAAYIEGSHVGGFGKTNGTVDVWGWYGDTVGIHYGACVGNSSSTSKFQDKKTIQLTGEVTARIESNFSSSLVQIPTTISSAGFANHIKVLTGTIHHGSQIPIPSGYTSSQCSFMVSIANSNPSDITWDIDENSSKMHYKTRCNVSSSGVVTAIITVFEDAINGTKDIEADANYMVIAIR